MTGTTGQIVVGIDGSRASSAALRYAAADARRTRARVHLVHVVPDLAPLAPMRPVPVRDHRDAGRAILSAATAELSAAAPEVSWSTSLLEPPRVSRILEAAEGARTVVLGRGRHPVGDRLLLASTVTAVAASARCPVVAVPADWPGPRTEPVVAVGAKSTSGPPSLLCQALDAATERDARLVVVHAWEVPGGYADFAEAALDVTAWQARARGELEAALAPLREGHPGLDVEVRVVHGQAARALLQASAHADLTLLVRRAHAFPAGHLGGTARAVLRHSGSPVVVLPPDR